MTNNSDTDSSPRRSGQPRPAWHAEAQRLRAEGLSVGEISLRLNIHPVVIYRDVPGMALRKVRSWTADEDQLLGTAEDREVAQRLGRTVAQVAARRRYLGILTPGQKRCQEAGTVRPRTGSHGRATWHAEARELRARGLTLKEIGQRFGKTRQCVALACAGIRPAGRGLWTSAEDALLGRFPDVEVARRTGRSVWAVASRRFALGIRTFGFVPWTPEWEALLGTMPDAELARMTGRTKMAVTSRRAARGIRAFRRNRTSANSQSP